MESDVSGMSLYDRFRKIFIKYAEHVRSFNIAQAGKWSVLFILIGIIAGLGSIVFHYLCGLGSHYFMDMMAYFMKYDVCLTECNCFVYNVGIFPRSQALHDKGACLRRKIHFEHQPSKTCHRGILSSKILK